MSAPTGPEERPSGRLRRDADGATAGRLCEERRRRSPIVQRMAMRGVPRPDPALPGGYGYTGRDCGLGTRRELRSARPRRSSRALRSVSAPFSRRSLGQPWILVCEQMNLKRPRMAALHPGSPPTHRRGSRRAARRARRHRERGSDFCVFSSSCNFAYLDVLFSVSRAAGPPAGGGGRGAGGAGGHAGRGRRTRRHRDGIRKRNRGRGLFTLKLSKNLGRRFPPARQSA